MKKTLLLLSAGLVLLTAGLMAFINVPKPEVINPTEEFVIPEDVKVVLDKSCYGCHNSESSNEKGKAKLEWDKLGDLSKPKLVGKLGEVKEIVEKGEMPPAKFLEKYPDKALTDNDKKTLTEWASSSAENLMK